jgi:hypothetical protein
MLVPSKDGYRYYIIFNCLFSKWCWITFLKQKTVEAVLDAKRRFITDAQSETGLRMSTFLTDNGSEYYNRDMDNAAQWHEAALEELRSHNDRGTWTLKNLPQNAKPIKGRWNIKKKDLQGKIIYKKRFMAKGYSQIQGIDYQDTYSSVLAYTSFRILVYIAVNRNWKIYQKDFKTAYLNASLLIPIFIEQPEGFVKQGKDQHKVCLLNKALYGLK